MKINIVFSSKNTDFVQLKMCQVYFEPVAPTVFYTTIRLSAIFITQHIGIS